MVDGKQRLLTLFEFAANEFPVSSEATTAKTRDKYFKDLDDDTKRGFWRYQFAVEFIPSEDEALINTVFDRINRNVAKLTRQELRHAKFSGIFITKVEELSEWTFDILPKNFPFIQASSRKQMKDDEFVAQLLLLIESNGPKSYSQDDLDAVFSKRDIEWTDADATIEMYRSTIQAIKDIVAGDENLARGRLKNQADFYSLVGAVAGTLTRGEMLDLPDCRLRLRRFISMVEDDSSRGQLKEANEYYAATRSASNDPGPRQIRIKIMTDVINGATHLP